MPPPAQQPLNLADPLPMRWYKVWEHVLLPLQLILAIPVAVLGFVFLAFNRSTEGLVDCCVKAVYFVAIFALTRLLLPEFRDRAQDGLRHFLYMAGIGLAYFLYSQVFTLLTEKIPFSIGVSTMFFGLCFQLLYWIFNYLYLKKRLVNP